VTVTFARPIAAGSEIRLQILGRLPSGLTDQDGNPLNGASTQPNRAGGSDFVAYYRRGVQVIPT
jgi:hypothetical protein